MVAGLLQRAGFTLQSTVGSNVGFVAEDRIDPGLAGRLIRLKRPVQVAVIGERQRVHLQLFRARNELSNWAGAVEQAEVAVTMKMCEGRHYAIRANSILVISEKVPAHILTLAACM